MADEIWIVVPIIIAAISAVAAVFSAYYALKNSRVAANVYTESVQENKRREAKEKRARENEALNFLSTFNLENWNLFGLPTPTTPAWNKLKEDVSKLVSFRGNVPDGFKEDFNLVCEYMSFTTPPTDPRFKDGMKKLEELRQRAHEEMMRR